MNVPYFLRLVSAVSSVAGVIIWLFFVKVDPGIAMLGTMTFAGVAAAMFSAAAEIPGIESGKAAGCRLVAFIGFVVLIFAFFWGGHAASLMVNLPQAMPGWSVPLLFLAGFAASICRIAAEIGWAGSQDFSVRRMWRAAV